MTDIIGFNGPPRSGKTAAVATLALWYLRHGYTVLSNFEIYHPHARMVDVHDLIEMLKAAMEWNNPYPIYPRTVLAAQEIYGWLESRMTQDKAVLLMGYFVFYSGKMGISIIYDAQLNSSADKRLKYNVTRRFEAEQQDQKFVYWELDVTKTEENVRTGRKRTIRKEWLARNVFPYYNTYKVSKPIGFDRWLQTVNF